MKNKALAFARAIRWRELLLDNAAWFAGCVLFSAGIIIFAVPNDIAQSGITGAAIMVNYLIHTPIGLTNLVLNIPLIIAAWIVLGKRFVAKTLWTTVMLSVCLDAMEYLLPAS
nr:YitT family protein [Clostridiales bacterium]